MIYWSEYSSVMKVDWGWGFCGEDCNQEEEEADSGVLRSVDDAHIMSQEFTDNKLEKLQNGSEYKFLPKILFVGKNHSLRFEMYSTEDSVKEEAEWDKVDQTFLKSNTRLIRSIYTKNLLDLDEDGSWVSSTGSCKGDSGGPMFINSE